MNTKVSVIVPVYNAEKFLDDCILSVLGQTYSDLEILLLDDCSTDGSAAICKKYAAQDPRVMYHLLPHGGETKTRNTGMDLAGGDYLLFVDSDDLIDPQYVENLLGSMLQNGAKLGTGLTVKFDDGEPKSALLQTEDKTADPVLYQDEARFQAFFDTSNINFRSIGGCIVEKELAQAIRFNETMPRGGDTLFTYQYISESACICLEKTVRYYYRIHQTNAIHNGGIRYFESLIVYVKYVCTHEVEQGRTTIARDWKNGLLYHFFDWYGAYRKQKDKASAAKARRLVNENYALLFSDAAPLMRIYAWLCFRCYPLFALLQKVWHLSGK